MPFDTQTTFETPTGARLLLRIRNAVSSPKAVVHLSHGISEHGGRYARFADYLAGRGFHVYVDDHRGHGGTTAPDAPLGRFAANHGADTVIADVISVRDRIAAEHPHLPIVLVGHSLGGIIALNVVLSHPHAYRAAAIMNANFSAGLLGRIGQLLLAWERFRLGSDVPSRILPRLTFEPWARAIENAATPFDWLTRDAAEVKAYVNDPLCGWPPSVSMSQDVLELVFRGADDRNFAALPRDMPFLLVGGAADPSTDHGKAVQALGRRMQAMGFSNLKTTIYPDTRHESLNELNRDMIMADIADWLDQAVA